MREREIREAIEFADKQKVKIILADAYECYKAIPEIKAHNIPVKPGSTLRSPINPDDPYDRSYTTPAELQVRASSTPSPLPSAQIAQPAVRGRRRGTFGLAHDDVHRGGFR